MGVPPINVPSKGLMEFVSVFLIIHKNWQSEPYKNAKILIFGLKFKKKKKKKVLDRR